jgi:MSHA biogenesis protein MshI
VRQEINLYAPIFRAPRESFAAATILRTGLLALAVMAVLYAYAAWQVAGLARAAHTEQVRHNALAARIAELEARQGARAADQTLTKRISTLTGERNAKTRALARIAQGVEGGADGAGPHFAEVFEGLARQRLQGLWLTAIHIGAGGGELALEGSAQGGELLPRYLTRLSGEPAFRGREFQRLAMQRAPSDQAGEAGQAGAAAHLDFALSTQAEAP